MRVVNISVLNKGFGNQQGNDFYQNENRQIYDQIKNPTQRENVIRQLVSQYCPGSGSSEIIIAHLIRAFIYEFHEKEQLKLIWNGNNHIDIIKLKSWLESKEVKDDQIEKLLQSFIVTKQIKQSSSSNICKEIDISIRKQESQLSFQPITFSYKEEPTTLESKISYCSVNNNYTAMFTVTDLGYNRSGTRADILDEYIKEASTYLASPCHSPHDLVRLIIDIRWRTAELSYDGSNEVRLINCIYNLTKRSPDGLGRGVWKALAFACMADHRCKIDKLFDKNNKFRSDIFYVWLRSNNKGSKICDFLIRRYIENISLSEDKTTIIFGKGYNTTIENLDSGFEVKPNKERLLELDLGVKFCEYLSGNSTENGSIDNLFDSRTGKFYTEPPEFQGWMRQCDLDEPAKELMRKCVNNIKISGSSDNKRTIIFGKYIKIEAIEVEKLMKAHFESRVRDAINGAAYIGKNVIPTISDAVERDECNEVIGDIETVINSLMVDLGYGVRKLTIIQDGEGLDPVFKVFLGLAVPLIKIMVTRYAYMTQDAVDTREQFEEKLARWCQKSYAWNKLNNMANLSKFDEEGFRISDELFPTSIEHNNDGDSIVKFMVSRYMIKIIDDWDIKKSWVNRYKDTFLEGNFVNDDKVKEFLEKNKDILLEINQPDQLRCHDFKIQYNLKPYVDGSEWLNLDGVSGRPGGSGEKRGDIFLNLVNKYFKDNKTNLYQFLTTESFMQIGELITSNFALTSCFEFVKICSLDPNFETDEFVKPILNYLMLAKFILGILERDSDFQDAKKYYLEFFATLVRKGLFNNSANAVKGAWNDEVSNWESFIIEKYPFLADRQPICDKNMFFDNSDARKNIFQQLSLAQKIALIKAMYENRYKSTVSKLQFTDDRLYKALRYSNLEQMMTHNNQDFTQSDPIRWIKEQIYDRYPIDDQKASQDDQKAPQGDNNKEINALLKVFRQEILFVHINDYAENRFKYDRARMLALVDHIANTEGYEKIEPTVKEYVDAVLSLTLYKRDSDGANAKPINKATALNKFSEYCCNAMNEKVNKADRKEIIEAIFTCMKNIKSDIVKGKLTTLVNNNVFTQITEKRNFFSRAKMPTGAYFALATLYISDQGIYAMNPPSFKFPVSAFKNWISKHNYDNRYFEIDGDLTSLEEKIKIIQISPTKYEVKFDSTNRTIWSKGINYAEVPALTIVLLDDIVDNEIASHDKPKSESECHERTHRIMRDFFGQKIAVRYDSDPCIFASPIFSYHENMLFDYNTRKRLYNTVFNLIIKKSGLAILPEYQSKITTNETKNDFDLPSLGQDATTAASSEEKSYSDSM